MNGELHVRQEAEPRCSAACRAVSSIVCHGVVLSTDGASQRVAWKWCVRGGGDPSTCGPGASAPLVSPLSAVCLSRAWRESSISLRGRPQGERVRNRSRERLTRVLGTHGFVPVSSVLCTRGPLGSGEESSRGPSWVGS